MRPRALFKSSSPSFQPVTAPVMLWDESSVLNASGPVSSNLTVKVRVLAGQGLASRGWPGGLQEFTPKGALHAFPIMLSSFSGPE